MYDIKVDIQPILKLTGKKAQKQGAYILSSSLNNLAFEARKQLKEELPKHFTLRNKWTERSLYVWKARKGESLVSVGSKAPYMADQVTGNPSKTKDNGGWFALPRAVRKSKKQLVRKTKWPNRLLQKKKFYMEDGAIWERPPKRKKNAKPRMMYRLEKQIRIKPRWPLHETVERVASSKWNEAFNKAWDRAFKTAR